jgi:penicillin-binding protein 1A
MVARGVFGQLPSLHELENPSLVLASEVFAGNGSSMGKFYTAKGNRVHVEYKDISPNVINALVSTEDERFMNIPASTAKRSCAPYWNSATTAAAAPSPSSWRFNMFNGERSHHRLSRMLQKLKEWIIAIELERNFTKQEILTLYLNDVSFSDNVYGIRAAARTFFQKEPDSLSVDEAAVLVGMVNNPSLFNPRTNPKAATDRRNIVLNRLVTNHYLPKKRPPLKAKPIDLSHYRKLDENNGIAPYFRDVLRGDLKKWCKEHTNPATGQPYNLYTGRTEDLYHDRPEDAGLCRQRSRPPDARPPKDARCPKRDPQRRSLGRSQQYPRSRHAQQRRWQDEEDAGMSDAEIRNSFNTP